MRITLGWARCADNVADILRRGAWYPIVEESPDGHVVVEVRQQRVRLARVDVTVRAEPPDHWSIVARTGVLRPTLGGRGSDGAAPTGRAPRTSPRSWTSPAPPRPRSSSGSKPRGWWRPRPTRKTTAVCA